MSDGTRRPSDHLLDLSCGLLVSIVLRGGKAFTAQNWSAYIDCVDRLLRLFGLNPAIPSNVDVSFGYEDISLWDGLFFETDLAGALAHRLRERHVRATMWARRE